MNQKQAKKLRKLLRGAVEQRDGKQVAEVTAPGVITQPTIKTKQVSYTENEKHRKMATVPLSEAELVQARAWAEEKDKQKLANASPEFMVQLDPKNTNQVMYGSDIDFSSVGGKTKVPTTKQVMLAAGTLMVSQGTIRGTYLALKSGLRKGAKL